MKVRIEAGDGMHFADMHATGLGDCRKLGGGKISELPLNRLEVLKDAIGVVRRWPGLD